MKKRIKYNAKIGDKVLYYKSDELDKWILKKGYILGIREDSPTFVNYYIGGERDSNDLIYVTFTYEDFRGWSQEWEGFSTFIAEKDFEHLLPKLSTLDTRAVVYEYFTIKEQMLTDLLISY